MVSLVGELVGSIIDGWDKTVLVGPSVGNEIKPVLVGLTELTGFEVG